MVVGKKYMSNAIFYTMFRKHYCPVCGTKLSHKKVSKIVNSNSPEAKNYDFSLGDSFMTGDVKFIGKVFYCPSCGKEISVSEMRNYEKAGKTNL